MNIDLLKAILSRDSYNRGYDVGMIVSGDSIGQAQIRKTILNNQEINLDSAILRDVTTGERRDDDIGFYAIAYNIKATDGSIVDTVISYRGTDFPKEGQKKTASVIDAVLK